jgi:hypothetical protein
MRERLLNLLLAGLIVGSLTPRLPAQEQQAAQGQENEEANPNEITIPEGTEFKLQLHTTISSKVSKVGDRVLTTLLDPVAVEDTSVLPKGVRIDGHIGEVKAAARRGKGGTLSIVFDTVEMPNGEKVAIMGSLTEVFASEGGGDPNVGPEGELKGKGPSVKKRAAIAAVPMAAGAATAVAGGATAVGIAMAAGGVVAAILLPTGQQAALSAGSLIGMRLDRDVSLTIPPQALASPAPQAAQNPPSPQKK